MRQAVTTADAPQPTGPFNQAIRCGNLVFTAGQAGRNRETGKMGDAREQMDWALHNITAILAAAGTTMANVVKVTVYLKDGAENAGLNEVYTKHFTDPLPARSLVYVPRLKNAEMLVEIEAVAVVD